MASSKRLLLCIFDMSDKIHIIPICILCILCRQSLCFLYVSCTNWHSYLNAYFNLSNLLNSSICFACDWYLSFHFPYSIFSKVYNINWEQVFFVTNLNWGCNIMKCCTFFISKSIYCTRIFHFYFFFFSVFWQLLYIFIRPYLTRHCPSTSTIKYSFAQWSPYQTILSFICKTTYKNHNLLYRNSCRPQNTSVKSTTGKKPMQSLSSFFFVWNNIRFSSSFYSILFQRVLAPDFIAS